MTLIGYGQNLTFEKQKSTARWRTSMTQADSERQLSKSRFQRFQSTPDNDGGGSLFVVYFVGCILLEAALLG